MMLSWMTSAAEIQIENTKFSVLASDLARIYMKYLFLSFF